MNRTIRKTFQWSLVGFLTAVLGSGPASAGWLRDRMKCHQASDCCETAPVYAAPSCQPACPAPEPACCPTPMDPCVTSHSVHPSPVAGCCGGTDMSMDMGMPIPMEGQIIDGYSSEAPMIYEGSAMDGMGSVESYDSGTIIEPAPMEQPFESDAVESAPVESSPSDNDASSDLEPADSAAADTEPATADAAPPASDMPADDNLFDAPEDEAAANSPPPTSNQPADDPFAAPFDEPEAEAAASEADPFGAPMDDAPADDAGNDLFSDPAPAKSAPAEAPMDDLFGDSPATDAPPAEAPVDDLFSDPPATDAPPAEAPVDDLFSDPPATDTPPAEDSSIDDLFGDSKTFDSKEPVDPAIEALFGSNSEEAMSVIEELPAPKTQSLKVVSRVDYSGDALAKARSRTWIDNTGNFHIQGKLLEINENHIRLIKSNGRTCTVPNDRMCEADEAYVASIRAKMARSQIAMLIDN